MSSVYSRWTLAERVKLRKLLAQGLTPDDMAKRLPGRTRKAVIRQLASFGVTVGQSPTLTYRSYQAPAPRSNDDAKHLTLIFQASAGMGFAFGVYRKRRAA